MFNSSNIIQLSKPDTVNIALPSKKSFLKFVAFSKPVIVVIPLRLKCKFVNLLQAFNGVIEFSKLSCKYNTCNDKHISKFSISLIFLSCNFKCVKRFTNSSSVSSFAFLADDVERFTNNAIFILCILDSLLARPVKSYLGKCFFMLLFRYMLLYFGFSLLIVVLRLIQ